MNKTRATLFTLLLALVVGGLFLLWRSLDDTSRNAATTASTPAAQEPAPSAPAAELSAQAAASSGAPEARAPASLGASPAAVQQNFALEGAHWVAGSLRPPAGSPADDTLSVVALDLHGESDQPRFVFGNGDDPTALLESLRGPESNARWARRSLEADGSFRVPAPADATRVLLIVDGRYLYLPERVVVELEPAPAPVVLQPELGAWLVGHCTLAGEASLEDARAGAKITGSGFSMSGGKRGNGRFVRRATVLDDELGFELRALPALTYSVSVSPQRLCDASKGEIEAAAGQRVEVALELSVGARVSGKVLDEAGAPIAEVQLRCESEGRRQRGMVLMFGDSAARSAQSASDGSFELLGLTPGKLHVRAVREGWVKGDSGELELAEGALLAGLEIRLSRGGSVAGKVSYPDGRVANKVVVSARTEVEPQGKQRFQREVEDHSAVTDEQGAFSISGLGQGPFLLTAHFVEPPAKQTEAPAPVAAGTDDEGVDEDVHGGGRRIDNYVWIARRSGVAAGTKDLALVLEPPAGLAGRVVDESGVPVPSFIVSVSPEWSKGTPTDNSLHALRCDDPAGQFHLTGVPAGNWRVSVEAEGFVQGEDKPLVVVPLERELVLTIGSAGRIAGLVVDPLGQPVPKATVNRRASGDANPWGGMGRDQGDDTDAKGAFVLKDVPSGAWELSAFVDGWAKSPPTPVTLSAGQKLEGIVLTLRRGGTMEGEVFASAGEKLVGRAVQIMSMDAADMRQAKLDERGHFLEEHLTPGTYQVILQPDEKALAEMAKGAEEGNQNPGDFLSKMKMSSCSIVEGETTHVVLGAPPKDPVRVFGRITRSGEPVAKCTVVVVNEGGALMQSMKFATADADGRYEITLDKPGDIVFVVAREMGRNDGIEFHLSIPEVAQHQVDLRLPLGAIRGTVRGPDGAPLAEVEVELARDRAPSSMMMMGGPPSARSDEQGHYAFLDLHPGSYTVAAGGTESGFFGVGSSEDEVALARAVRAGLVVGDDKALEGIDLTLGKPGTIAGIVKNAQGQPVPSAIVFARDASGELVHRLSTVTSDQAGKFAYRGLAEGRYTLSARTPTLAARDSAAVSVRAGDTVQCELTLDTGTFLVITVTDPNDKPVRAGISVQDERGHEQANAVSLDAMMQLMNKGITTTERRVGPLPAGKYLVIVTASDGKTTKKPVTLAGQDERKLRVRLD